MPSFYQISFLLFYFLKAAIAKECRYILDTGDIQYYHCNLYEYCCGRMCCRSPAMTFYQLWYFWLMVFLTILFCSGGGWWYKIRNHDGFMSPSGRVMPPQLASYHEPNRPQVYPQGNAYFQASGYPPQTTTPLAPNPAHYPPPPPYYGPPPSYDTVVNQARQG